MITPQTFYIALYTWIAFAIMLFPILLKITAPYGRHSKSNWGPMINNRTGWIIMELPALFVFGFLFLTGPDKAGIPIWIFFSCWTVHYFNRVVVFPLRINTRGKKMPLVIMVFALFFNLFNGFFNGYFFGFLSASYPLLWLSDPRFIAGIAIFLTGMYINMYSDQKLINLRKSKTQGYMIPRGGLFEYISCPNHFGEIVEWIGFALMTWCLPALSFAVWTIANLLPRALHHHQWYQNHFENYPENRKAVIPFML